jgi:hypothetical protein
MGSSIFIIFIRTNTIPGNCELFGSLYVLGVLGSTTGGYHNVLCRDLFDLASFIFCLFEKYYKNIIVCFLLRINPSWVFMIIKF